MMKISLHYLSFLCFLLFAGCYLSNEINERDPTSCPMSYYYNSTNSTCDLCSTAIQYCYKCSNGSVCEQCDGQYVSLVAGKCVANCSEGYYLNPNATSAQSVCLSCPYNCKSCSNYSFCDQCESSYIWNVTQHYCLPSSGCYPGEFYNSTLGYCQQCSDALKDCNICYNSSYCTSCWGTYETVVNGKCECITGTFEDPNGTYSLNCQNCSANCISCNNLTSCNQCETSFTFNTTSQLCTKSIIDLTINVTIHSEGNYWDLTLNTTGIPQIYQIILSNDNLPGAFYWTKNDIYPNIYVSTNCSSQCAAFSQPSETNFCLSTPQNNQTDWNILTDESIMQSQCILQFFVPQSYALNQSYNFYYFPETTLQEGQNGYYYGNSSYFRYFTYTFTGMTGIEDATYTITIENNSSVLIKEIYIGSNNPSDNCNYIFPSASNHCTGLQQTNISEQTTTYSYTTTNPNTTFYFAISLQNSYYAQFYVDTSFQCNAGYYQPSYYQNECLQIINESVSWNLTGLSTQWQTISTQFWQFPLNYTQNVNNVYNLKLQSTESLGTFYLFFNENYTMQNIYISTNCTNQSTCSSENYTSTPTAAQHCFNALLNDIDRWSLSTQQNVGQCNFYFTIPAGNSKPPIQFAYYPQLPLENTQNYTNISIPWLYSSTQYFTYSVPNSNYVYKVTLSNLNRAVVNQLLFSSNDPHYSTYYCNNTFPTFSSSYSECNISQNNYSQGNMDYYMYTFTLSSGSSAVFGFVTHQNGSYNSFDIQSNYTISCSGGAFYNVTSSQCVNCSLSLDYCSECLNNQTCTQCTNSDLQIISGKCVANCPTDYYQNPNITAQSSVCLPCMENCISCTNNSTCSQCNSSYYWNTTSGSCEPQVTGCNSGQYFNQTTQSCQSCQNAIWSCKICSNSKVCTQCSSSQLTINEGKCQCPQGQYINPDTSSSTLCLNCLAHCITCSNSSQCTQCQSSYTWNSTSLSCEPSSTGCPSGTFQNSTNLTCVQCSSVIEYCETCSNSTICTSCINSGQFLVDGKCIVHCSSGYYKNPTITASSQMCLPCMNYCISCTNNQTCSQCKSSYFWNATTGSCQPQAISCSSGQYPNPNPQASSSELCLSCMSHCVQCTSATTCEECYESTYKWSDIDHKCESLCKEGQYYDVDKQSCINCEVQYCTVCYGSGKQCNECTDGYEPIQSSSDDIACQKIHTKPKSGQTMQIGVLSLLILLILLFIEIQ